MANLKVATSLALVSVALLCAGAAAQSSCTTVLITLSPCLNYITGNSSSPSSQCCTQLANVVRASAQCLCQALNANVSSLGLNINRTQALALPGACNVQTPPISSCNAGSPAASPAGSPDSGSTVPSAGSPSASPAGSPDSGSTVPSAGSPAASPAGTPDSGSTVPSGTGSNTVPSTQGDGSSDGSSIKLSISLLAILLLATSYSSISAMY